MDTAMLIEKSILVILLFLVSLGAAAYMTYFERKLAAWIQDRVGPDRAGPFGILQPIADGVKMFLKEDFIPAKADKWLFIIGPGIAMFTALITSAVIPWGPKLHLFGRDIVLQVADINIGILYVFGVISIGVYGIMIGGWASNNKYSLYGAIRASSQMISYELAMGVSAITIVLLSGSLSLTTIVEGQSDVWNIFYQPVAFLIFFICALAELNRAPFDLPECESELVGGYHTEYSSMKLGLYLFAEYTSMFVSSAIMAILFFGGYNFPGMSHFSGNTLAILGIAAFATKIFLFIFVIMWIRWTIPRFRFDQLMHLGWKSLLPLSLINLLVTGLVIAYKNGWF
ncbi:MAG: NADH-quinone oxidoreductase subunit NuoH [Crocinitomicaceae bacterium]|jgi:NADH-quinone oxidoreductase subunit H|nr:NADH-quinone oxidoreductase subunit NuoH [Crocinitomicaceae bacterium]MDP4723185.1 NADH-quinone oxidoreductase subunit NuoH [Crocinitomicaceae bacterium]MDP4740047.1 NADH-quinone oxidoreductase subunit NuoH [Crocinitomicaceae bacterium]MDP4799863.1 NADH-quinone oxidoreductase subunit NuoH [Crocinitomicaceae bacterium]MDP4807396.1 NADH-quinone oxidoreductase subunit NuoH [Crocinitomicaceae bacterium]